MPKVKKKPVKKPVKKLAKKSAKKSAKKPVKKSNPLAKESHVKDLFRQYFLIVGQENFSNLDTPSKWGWSRRLVHSEFVAMRQAENDEKEWTFLSYWQEAIEEKKRKSLT